MFQYDITVGITRNEIIIIITTNITIRVQNGRRAQNGWLQIPKISPLFWTFAPNTFLVFP